LLYSPELKERKRKNCAERKKKKEPNNQGA
jgi:hypothetical protein